MYLPYLKLGKNGFIISNCKFHYMNLNVALTFYLEVVIILRSQLAIHVKLSIQSNGLKLDYLIFYFRFDKFNILKTDFLYDIAVI